MILQCLALAFIASADVKPDMQNEAQRLTELTVSTFFDAEKLIWRAPEVSTEMVGDQGYTFWPSLLAWQMTIEAARTKPKEWRSQVKRFFGVLEKYFDKENHAYCAWVYFPGNDDKFYDDNAWAAAACVEAYEVTKDPLYRQRASEVFTGFVQNGWDKERGGVRWGTKAGFSDRKDRTVSATAASALAGLLIDKSMGTTQHRAWSKKALDWIRTELSTKDGLVYDGFYGETGKRMDTIWTYNTGVPIRAAVAYYEATKDRAYLSWAKKMGDAAINRELSPMYDGATRDPNSRYWYDAVYFVQYLADGLWHLSKAAGDGRYLDEAKREGAYAIRKLKDVDGLYWRNMRLWTISKDCHKSYLDMTKQEGPVYTPEESERSYEAGEMKIPVAERKLVKTLLANAGMARMLWILCR